MQTAEKDKSVRIENTVRVIAAFAAAGIVYLYYDLSVLGQDNVLQRVLHQQREVHLIHGHVRQRGLLQKG